jgi:hypothetical protein
MSADVCPILDTPVGGRFGPANSVSITRADVSMVIRLILRDINRLMRAQGRPFACGERLAPYLDMTDGSKVMRLGVIAMAFGAVLGVQSPTACLAEQAQGSLAGTRSHSSDVLCEDAFWGPPDQTGWLVDQSGCPMTEDIRSADLWDEP